MCIGLLCFGILPISYYSVVWFLLNISKCLNAVFARHIRNKCHCLYLNFSVTQNKKKGFLYHTMLQLGLPAWPARWKHPPWPSLPLTLSGSEETHSSKAEAFLVGDSAQGMGLGKQCGVIAVVRSSEKSKPRDHKQIYPGSWGHPAAATPLACAAGRVDYSEQLCGGGPQQYSPPTTQREYKSFNL